MSNQAQEVSKGLPTIAWIGIGCGALLIIAGIVIAVGVFFVARTASDVMDDFEANPALTAARVFIKANPDLEEVSMDEEAGTITIRNTNTGEVVTVDFEDVREGRIVFGTEDGEVTLEADQEGGSVQVRGSGPDGAFEYSAGAADAEGVPEWIPLYPGAEIQGAYAMKNSEGAGGGFQLRTADGLEEVFGFYRERLEADGLTVHETRASAGGNAGGVLQTDKDPESGRLVHLTVSRESGETLISVSYNDPS